MKRDFGEWFTLAWVVPALSFATWSIFNPNESFCGPTFQPSRVAVNLVRCGASAVIIWGFYEFGRWQEGHRDRNGQNK